MPTHLRHRLSEHFAQDALGESFRASLTELPPIALGFEGGHMFRCFSMATANCGDTESAIAFFLNPENTRDFLGVRHPTIL